MIIKQIHINNFGKFADYTINFTDGFNIVFGNNEDGKSTLMAFLRLMFYPSDGGKRGVSGNRRLKYQPWSGAPMGGDITFVSDGKEYRLERTFAASASSDKVQVWNIASGKQEKLPAKIDAGKHFFGIDADTFEKSVFLGEIGAFSADRNGSHEICARLQNLVSTGEDDISFSKVEKRLESASELLEKKSGKKGLLVEAAAECERVTAELDDAIREENEISDDEEKITLLRDEAHSLEEELEKLKGAAHSAELKKIIRIQNDADSLSAQREKLSEELTVCGKTADAKFVSEMKSSLQTAKTLEKQLGSAKDGEDEACDITDDDIRFLNEQRTLLDGARESLTLIEAAEKLDDERAKLLERLEQLKEKRSLLETNAEGAMPAEEEERLRELEKELEDARAEMVEKRIASGFAAFSESKKEKTVNFKVIVGIIIMMLSIALIGFQILFLIPMLFGIALMLIGAMDLSDESKARSEEKRRGMQDEVENIARIKKTIDSVEKEIESIHNKYPEYNDDTMAETKSALAVLVSQEESLSERLAELNADFEKYEPKLETLFGSKKPELHGRSAIYRENIETLKKAVAERLEKIGADSIANAQELYIRSGSKRERAAVAKSNEQLADTFEQLRGKFTEALGTSELDACGEIIERLEKGVAEAVRLDSEYRALLVRLDEELDGRSVDEVRSELETLPVADEEMSADYNELSEKYTLLREKIAASEAALELKTRGHIGAAVLEEELKADEARRDALKAEQDALTLASELVHEAFEEMQQSFAPILNERAAEILSQLTGGRYEQLTVDRSFTVSARTSGSGLHSWEYLSSGTVDQAYFALRLAVAELVDKTLPLMLDDAFVQYDDLRTKQAINFLSSRKNQSILFTCKSEIGKLSDDARKLSI